MRPTLVEAARRSPRVVSPPARAPDSPRTAGLKREATKAALAAGGSEVGPKSPRAADALRVKSPTGRAAADGVTVAELWSEIEAVVEQLFDAAAAHFDVETQDLRNALADVGYEGDEARAYKRLTEAAQTLLDG